MPSNNPVLWEKTGPKKRDPRKPAFNYLQDKKLEAEEVAKIKKEIGEPFIGRDEGEREEKKVGGCDTSIDRDFREIMFENAPKKNKDFIIAEKKKW